MKINTILIDDEPKALAILEDKLKRLCKEVTVVNSFQKPKEAIQYLKENEVDLVFLDVAMPEVSGFDVLKQIQNPDFELIFATGFDQYAIEAINHCAIGYLVKPIDNDDLVTAVTKAKENIIEKSALKKNRLLIENLSVKKFQDKKVVIPTQEGLEFIEIQQILFCEGIDGYTRLNFVHRKPILSSQSIGSVVKMLESKDFYQVHKSFLVNLSHIDKYLNEGYLLIKDHKIPVARARRQDFLEMIRKSNS